MAVYFRNQLAGPDDTIYSTRFEHATSPCFVVNILALDCMRYALHPFCSKGQDWLLRAVSARISTIVLA